jgi:hypothetical protein
MHRHDYVRDNDDSPEDTESLMNSSTNDTQLSRLRKSAVMHHFAVVYQSSCTVHDECWQYAITTYTCAYNVVSSDT